MKTNGGTWLVCAHTYGRGFASGGSDRNAFKNGSPVLASDSAYRRDPGVNTEGDKAGCGVGAGGGSSRPGARQTPRTAPHWMRRLEERWQKLHRQINAPSPAPASSDTWAVRRLHARRRETRLTRPTSSLTTHPATAAVRCPEDPKVSVFPSAERCCADTQAVGFLHATGRVDASIARRCQGQAGTERQNAPPSSAGSRQPAKRSVRSLGATERGDAFKGSYGSQSALAGDTTRTQHAADTDLTETQASSVAGSGEDKNGGDTSLCVQTAADDVWLEENAGVEDDETGSDEELGSRSAEEREMNGARCQHDEEGRAVVVAADTCMPADVRQARGAPALRPRPARSKPPHSTLASRAVTLRDQTEAAARGVTRPVRKADPDVDGPSRRTSRSMKTTAQQTGVRVFARMSIEARHAVTETLQEMRSTDKGQANTSHENNNNNNNVDNNGHSLQATAEDVYHICNGQEGSGNSDEKAQLTSSASSKDQASTRDQAVPFSPNQHRRSQKERDRTRSVNGAVTGGKSPRSLPFQKTSVRLAHPQTHKKDVKEKEEEEDDAGHLSLASTEGMSPEGLPPPVTFDRTRLPAIVKGTEKPSHGRAHARGGNRRHVNHRLRGVGFYRVPRERTFEITAPDFDIRYREVITCQKGDRDTPPPDIFERSVSKVKDWLTKYHTPR